MNARSRVLHYDELTWPEVAGLPRDLPMIIPLGLHGFDAREAARRLRCESICVLPAVPYGVPQPEAGGLGSLVLGRGLVRRMLLAIRHGLARQGFTRIVHLDCGGLGRRLADPRLRFLRLERTAPAARAWPEDLDRRIVVVTTGHTEQHGHHLAVGADTFIAAAIADGIAAAVPDQVVCLPAWPYGVSTHTDEFPATLNLGGRLFEDVMLALTGRLVSTGARMVFFSNGHGGNHSHLVNIVKAAGERWPQAFIATEFLHTTGPALEAIRESPRGGLGHGCELETSYMLHLRPDLVDMTKATVETDFVATPNYYMDWIEGGRIIANPPWTDDTQSGIYGDSTLATAEKGRRWLAAAIEEKIELFGELREQLERRHARRQSMAARGAWTPTPH